MDFIYFFIGITVYVIIGMFLFNIFSLFKHPGKDTDEESEEKLLIVLAWPLMVILFIVKGTWFLIDSFFKLLFYFPRKISKHFQKKAFLKKMPELGTIEYRQDELKSWASEIIEEYGYRLGNYDHFYLDVSGMIDNEWCDHIVLSKSLFGGQVYLCHDKIEPLSMARQLGGFDRKPLVEFCNVMAEFLKK